MVLGSSSPLSAAWRPALACVTAVLLAQACGLNYPQWAGLIALSTLAGNTGTAITPLTLLPNAAGVLLGAGLALVGVAWLGQERWASLAWLAALVFGCAAGGAWPRVKPFALAVGTTAVPATIFGVNDLPHALTAAWSRAGESFLGFAVVVAFDAAFGALFGLSPLPVGPALAPPPPAAWSRAWRAGTGAAACIAAALGLWYEAEVPSALALVLDASILALTFAAAPRVSLLGALTGSAAGSVLAAALMLGVWPALPQGPATFALPLLPALWALSRIGRQGAFGAAVGSFGAANLLVGLNLSAAFSPQPGAVLNRCVGLFVGGLASALILRITQASWPLPGPSRPPSSERMTPCLPALPPGDLSAIPMVPHVARR